MLLLRFADRQFSALLFQLPPRSTRFEPTTDALIFYTSKQYTFFLNSLALAYSVKATNGMAWFANSFCDHCSVQLLFDLLNFMRHQKGVHLLLGCTAVTGGYGKKLYLHGGQCCVTMNEMVAFLKKTSDHLRWSFLLSLRYATLWRTSVRPSLPFTTML